MLGKEQNEHGKNGGQFYLRRPAARMLINKPVPVSDPVARSLRRQFEIFPVLAGLHV
jgi:hypothetical protein